MYAMRHANHYLAVGFEIDHSGKEWTISPIDKKVLK
jgi:hypothetical protein